MTKEMLINTVEGHECRIAVVEDGVLEELYIERASSASRVTNIYKGRVTNVEPGIQAAFIDFGVGKNGFLHISDVTPAYFPRGQKNAEAVGRKRSHRDRPPIQECLRRGQEVVVQMTKEGIGTKGPTLTTYLSIPGRLLVMMPGMSRLGVSRKIQDEQARHQARAVLQDLELPPDMGFILRTAGLDRSKRDLQRDLHYLTRLWKAINQQIKTVKAPAEIYKESDLVIRTLRDVYNAEVERIICDSPDVARHVKDFLDLAMPRTKHSIELYAGKEGLFHDMGLEEEIEKVFARRVELRSGGWLAIDQAEALVAIDVNSGRFREHTDAETTALKINVEAAGDIARQLRLRDLGGVVIIDFIDMREEKNRRTVERTLREAVKKDRAKTKVLKISAFGIVEMTRQRVRPSLRDNIYRRCAACEGVGLVKSEESQALSVMRSLQRAICHGDVCQIEVAVTPQVAHHLSNAQRRDIAQLEQDSGKRVVIKADPNCRGGEIRITCTNSRGSTVAWDQPLAPLGKRTLKTSSFAQLVAHEEEPEEAEVQSEQIDLLLAAGAEEYPPDAEAQDDLAPLEATPDQQPTAPIEHPVEQPAQQPAKHPVEQPAKHPVEQAVGHPAKPPVEHPAAPAAATGAAQKPPGSGRRRGRRGGQRHRRKGQAQPAQPQPGRQVQPSQPGRQAPPPATGAKEPAASGRLPQAPAQPVQKHAQHAPRPAVAAHGAAPVAHAQPVEGAAGQAPGQAQAKQPGQADGGEHKPRRRGRRGGRRHRRKSTAPPGQAQGGQAPPPSAGPTD